MTTTMLPSLLLAWMLAGPAEPAPPEPLPAYPSPSPVSAQPTPAPPTAPPASLVPAPAGPAVPAPASAPAAPAPPPALPRSPPPDDSPPPPNTAGLSAGAAIRLGTVLAPAVGFAFRGSFNRRYALPAPSLALGWQLDFSFDRFSTSVDVPSATSGGQAMIISSTRTTTATAFAALQTLQVQVGSGHVWAGAGGGLSIGFLTSPEAELQGNTSTAYQPFARAVAGADFALDAQTAIGLHVGYAKMLTTATVTGAGNNSRWDLVGDLLDIQAGLFYRFR